MNLILFEKPFESIRLESGDARGQHILKVLRAEVGTRLFIGFANAERARAEVTALGEEGSVELKVLATEAAPAPLPVQLLIGLPRPHTAKRILFEAASMGVQALHFFESERGEPSYAQSRLWSSDEWKERLWLGTEQSFGTHIPGVSIHPDLQGAISHLETQGADSADATQPPAHQSLRVALDNYEADASLGTVIPEGLSAVMLALGSERGWSANERDTFRKNGWKLAHIGPHVLRAETAMTAVLGAVASQAGFWTEQTKSVLL